MIATTAYSPPKASNVPSIAEARPSNKLSVSNCRPILKRPAPSEARTAISRLRAAALASIRFETFVQAISSRIETALNSDP